MSALTDAIAIVSLTLVIAGCGNSNSNNDSANNNFTVLKGTVPGTLIEAFCNNGGYYAVHSVDNNTSEHPFSLAIPKNLNCRLVMSTNEYNLSAKVSTPIRINTFDGNSPLFYGAADEAPLGNIPLAMDRALITDSNGDGVSDELMDVLPEINGTLVTVILMGAPTATDSDGDGIPNAYEDDDGDHIPNIDDPDDDNDGIPDGSDPDLANDTDGDGVENAIDIDDDNDGIADELDHY